LQAAIHLNKAKFWSEGWGAPQMLDGIHSGGQVLVMALGIAEGGEKH
jgi:hypothetical protein